MPRLTLRSPSLTSKTRRTSAQSVRAGDVHSKTCLPASATTRTASVLQRLRWGASAETCPTSSATRSAWSVHTRTRQTQSARRACDLLSHYKRRRCVEGKRSAGARRLSPRESSRLTRSHGCAAQQDRPSSHLGSGGCSRQGSKTPGCRLSHHPPTRRACRVRKSHLTGQQHPRRTMTAGTISYAWGERVTLRASAQSGG